MTEIDKPVPQQLETLDRLSKLLDTQFRIPGTSTRFGLDFIIGLVPYAGDILSFFFSAGLVLTMVRHGASGQVLGKMLFNIFLDTTVGSVPIVGDVFDLYYKSNRRNYHLLQEHYGEGAYKGSIWKILIPLLIVIALMFVLMLWIIAKVVGFTWEYISVL